MLFDSRKKSGYSYQGPMRAIHKSSSQGCDTKFINIEAKDSESCWKREKITDLTYYIRESMRESKKEKKKKEQIVKQVDRKSRRLRREIEKQDRESCLSSWESYWEEMESG